jgi:glycosyltransferase involved in cell wall biosynthesis
MTLTVLATNPNSDLYGASRMMLESIRGFHEEGWEVTVSIPSRGPLVDEVEAEGARFIACPTPVLRKGDATPLGLLRLGWRTLASIPPGVRLLRRVRPDVLYANTIIEPLWLVLAWLLRIPVLCHVHEGESEASPLQRRVLAVPLLLASRLMVNSHFSMRVLTDSIRRLGERSEVVYNGVAGPPSPAPLRAEPGPPVRLLYLGRLSERKGVQDAIDAVAELERLGVPSRLEVVGSVFPGYEWVEEDLRARAAAAGTSERVHLRGFSADVWGHLADADVLLVPSRVDEPFGNTAVEGSLAGRPVVATSTSGLLEATDGMAAAVLVPPCDPAAMAAAVVSLVDRWPAVRDDALADAAKARARYDPAEYRATVRNLIEELCRANV